MLPLWFTLNLASASPLTAAVVARVVQNAEDAETFAQVELESAAVASLAYVPGLQALPRSMLLRLDEPARRCGADLACLRRALVEVGARWGWVLVLNLQEDPPSLASLWVDTATSANVLTHLEDLRAPVDARRLPSALLAALLAAQVPVGGLLEFDLTPPNAQVHWGAQPLGRTAALPPGLATLTVAAPGRVATSTAVVVGVGQRRRLSLTLDEPSVLRSPWFWVAVVAAAGAGALTWGLTRPEPDYVCVRGRCP